MSSDATSTVLTSLPIPPSLDTTFGAVLIGTFLGLIMYGLTVKQTLRYFRVYTADAFVLKFMIFCLALLDTGNTVVTMHVCYHYLITNYYNPSALLDGVCLNSRRSLAESGTGDSDFGTFKLGSPQQNSMQISAHLEHLRAPRSEGEAIDISSWKAPAGGEDKTAFQTDSRFRNETCASSAGWICSVGLAFHGKRSPCF
ncbi:hypothetical protein BD311DRAFT_677508 [Dichomitus squalens]|uniref:Uncharacterized protein n=1 Tax=Dichomitus squalens TaxID=114155 RepID=A0A4Q9M683_9APHY|nr:hypothetical protein BD311DRAFT_677508 [Dichomitus squalens]